MSEGLFIFQQWLIWCYEWVTSVGNVQYLEGGEGRCKSEEGHWL